MARDRLRVLLDFQPGGPYVLGGYCNGGVVAFEMARQLLEKGIKVDLLFIIDASVVFARQPWIWNPIAFAGSCLRLDHDAMTDRVSRMRRRMNRWQEISREGRRAQARFLIGKMRELLEKPFRPAANPTRPDAPKSRQQDGEELYRTYQHILRGYIPGCYPGRVVLLHTDSLQSRLPDDPSLGWRHVASRLEVRLIPGDHQTCLTEHVEPLAQFMASCLRNLS
jgi:thioesterase domain-containing protein